MKIVINACFGGFGLSDAAVKRYADLKGIPLWIETSPKYSFHTNYYIVPPESRAPEVSDWYALSLTDRIASNAAHAAETIGPSEIPRDDATLVQVVEELGDRSHGEFARLKVVEIPDGVDWVIEEYDGRETIAETHRTWD